MYPYAEGVRPEELGARDPFPLFLRQVWSGEGPEHAGVVPYPVS